MAAVLSPNACTTSLSMFSKSQDESSQSPQLHRSHLDTDMHYVKPNNIGGVPNHVELFVNHPDFLDTHPVRIRNARDANQDLSFPKTGFQFSRFTAPSDIDYMDKQQVIQKYLPELEQFMKTQLGASSVKAFSHKVRYLTYEPGVTDARKYSSPALRPHVDITSAFAPTLFRWKSPELYKDVTDNNKHWQIVNAWRPLKTVSRDPLVVADATSVIWADYLTIPQPEAGPGAEGWFLQKPTWADSGHRWWYMDTQTPEEILLFRQYDSKGSPVVPHTAISSPEPVSDEARESIEVRMIVVY